jgi:hypothetical protein
MNCEHSSKLLISNNDLICTACSLNRSGGNGANNANQPVKSTLFSFLERKLSIVFSNQNACGEQVLFVTFQENHARQEIFNEASFPQ